MTAVYNKRVNSPRDGESLAGVNFFIFFHYYSLKMTMASMSFSRCSEDWRNVEKKECRWFVGSFLVFITIF